MIIMNQFYPGEKNLAQIPYSFPIHIHNIGIPAEDEDCDEDEDWNEDIDAFVNDIASMTDARAKHRVDLGMRRDVGNAVTNVGGYLTMESGSTHTTTAMKESHQG